MFSRTWLCPWQDKDARALDVWSLKTRWVVHPFTTLFRQLSKDDERTPIIEMLGHILESSLISSLQKHTCVFHSSVSSHTLAFSRPKLRPVRDMVATNTVSSLKLCLGARACHHWRSFDPNDEFVLRPFPVLSSEKYKWVMRYIL